MSYFPKEYSIPKSSDNSKYTKFEEGKTRFRILSTPLLGFEYWNQDKKPVRNLDKFENIPEDAKLDAEGKFKQRHFWAMKVYNYNTSQVEILEITQKTIQNTILAYAENEDYGDPREYDITVTREGEKMETSYSVIASPPKTASNEVIDADMTTPVNLKALLTGENPFDVQLEEIDLESL
jgi:hypothetical protein